MADDPADQLFAFIFDTTTGGLYFDPDGNTDFNDARRVATISRHPNGDQLADMHADQIIIVRNFDFVETAKNKSLNNGKLIDGYIAGASIYLDANNNGVAEATEDTGVKTDANGNFDLLHDGTVSIIAVGGTNIDTGLPNTLILTAPPGASVVTPLTTLIQAYAGQAGVSTSEAEAAVQAGLGITADIDLTHYDPLAQAAGDATALAVQQVAAQVAQLGVNAQADGTGFDEITAAIATAIAADENVDLADRTSLETVLGAVMTDAALDEATATNAAINDAESLEQVSEVQAIANETTAPTVVSFTPPDEATGITIGSNVVLTFSETIALGTGSITLKTAAGTTVATYDVATSTNLTLSGNTLTLNPTADLAYSTGYKIEFSAGSIKDLAGNNYAGTTSYNFTTATAGQTITGTSTPDSLTGGGGNDTIDGAAGIDTAFFTGTRASHNLNKVGNSFVVADNSPNRDGTDTLTNTETLRFSDMTVDLTMGAKSLTISPANLKTLEEIYVGFFNRVPEAGGMAYWIAEIASGVTMKQVADRAYDAGVQYSDLTGYTANMTTAAYITKIYANVFGRSGATAPNADEIGYWATWLNQPGNTRGNMVLQMLSDVHTHFETSVQWGWVASLLNNKAAVANYYAIEQGLSFLDATSNITFGMQVAALITPTDTTAAIALIGVDEFSTLG